MGNGVPNQGSFPHFAGPNLVGFVFIYHDQQVTGNDWKPSADMTPTGYAALHAAAQQGQAAFEAHLATTAWAPFFAAYAIDKVGARLSVLKTLP